MVEESYLDFYSRDYESDQQTETYIFSNEVNFMGKYLD
jgi:hypothetical protein